MGLQLEFLMIKWTLSAVIFLTQLSAPSTSLPQVLAPTFKAAVPAVAGQKTEITVSFGLLKGYAINRTPPISLKLTPATGLKLDKTEFSTSDKDPKSKDEYYAELPTIKVPLTAAKAGKYQIPGTLTYFFCSKTDGFCSKQSIDVKIPVEVR
jgi:hypothetical protein